MSYNATVLGGFWPQQGVSDPAGTSFNSKMARLGYALRPMYDKEALLEALVGLAPPQAINLTRKRIEANVELGGLRIVETITVIARNTSAADVTYWDALLPFGGLDPVVAVANGDQNPLGTR